MEPTNEEMLEAIQPETAPEEAPQEAEGQGQEAPPEEAPQGYNFKSDDELFGHKLKYKAGGKEVEEDLQTILKRASQGYHYAQQMAELKKQQEEFNPKIEQAQTLEEKYGRFETYAKENPDWYNHWEKAWNERGQQSLATEGEADPSSDIEARINAILEDKLKTVNEFAQSVEDQKKQAEVQAQDRVLEKEIGDIREQYKDIDFDSTDPEDGKSLEYKVLEFQISNGLPSFEKAFKAFYHDNLVQRQVMKEKEAWVKEQQANAKKGIVEGQLTQQKTPDFSNSSYDQITDYAIKSLGLNT